MIKYIGSKRLLIRHIVDVVRRFPDVSTVLDLFSGTSRVAYALKQMGYRVHANDHLSYAATIARCHVEADANKVERQARLVIDDLRRVRPVDGYVTEVFCRQARFFQPANGARIDGVREAIDAMALDPVLEAIALTALMEAADRVDSTTGLQMAYLKQWAARSYNPLELRYPRLLPGGGSSSQLDAAVAAAEVEADLAYVDPPYNQHSYMGNYHVWETLVRWDKPEHYGVACKRVECREYRSPFNRKRQIADALTAVIGALRAKHIIVSFNDEGFLSRRQIEDILRNRGTVRTVSIDNKRYVGAQIGIHNPDGEVVGKVGALRNKEILFVVSEDDSALDGILDAPGTAAREAQLALF